MNTGCLFVRERRSILWPLLVIGISLAWPTGHASAVSRQQVEMGDPDVTDKPHSGPGQASAFVTVKSSHSGTGHYWVVLTWIRTLLYLRAMR